MERLPNCGKKTRSSHQTRTRQAAGNNYERLLRSSLIDGVGKKPND